MKDRANWDKMIMTTSALGGAKIFAGTPRLCTRVQSTVANRRACAGIVLLAVIPDNSACPSVSMSGLYMYPVLCIFLGITWIARGQRLLQPQGKSIVPVQFDGERNCTARATSNCSLTGAATSPAHPA